MAGGNWSPTDMPVLPGFYMNFMAAATASIQQGARGTVVVPVKAHWGPVREFVEITSESRIRDMYTDDESGGATAYTTLRFALMGGAQKVLAYRLAADTAATATLTLQGDSSTDVLKLEARYPGARGNNFKITVQTSLVDSTKKDIKLYDGTTLLRTFTFAENKAAEVINGDSENKWIVATKMADGVLADVSSVPMIGGDSGITGVTNADYMAALDAIEAQEFNVTTLDGISEAALRASVVSWVSRVRDAGKGIVAVLGGSTADDTAADAVTKAINKSAQVNHEGIVNVGTGAVLNGVRYSSAQVAAFVAGLIAGTPLSAATTYAGTPFEDVTRRWTRTEQEQAVRNGVFLLIHDGRQVKVLRGVNSLISLRQGQSNAWKKIRTISVMDSVNLDLQRTAEDSYIGKVNNTEEGRLALIGACKEYLRTLANAGVIESTGYDVYLDPDYPNPDPDQVFLKWEARLTDVMEQIFGTFIVK
ncbi:phage tail sheath family protein [Paenibacillus residui]|uniref:Phage tail sheath family protein n=1 Tax=Paenibacillus residui TaxID=629724 RepID=A0ABW3D613_9BACL